MVLRLRVLFAAVLRRGQPRSQEFALPVPLSTPWLDLLALQPGEGPEALGAGIRRLAVLAAATHRGLVAEEITSESGSRSASETGGAG